MRQAAQITNQPSQAGRLSIDQSLRHLLETGPGSRCRLRQAAAHQVVQPQLEIFDPAPDADIATAGAFFLFEGWAFRVSAIGQLHAAKPSAVAHAAAFAGSPPATTFGTPCKHRPARSATRPPNGRPARPRQVPRRAIGRDEDACLAYHGTRV